MDGNNQVTLYNQRKVYYTLISLKSHQISDLQTEIYTILYS